MKKTRKASTWVGIALVLCLISMLGASFVQTGGGKVTIKDLRWETSTGHQMSALLYIPDNATADNKAPAIVTSHGWYNNREMQDLNAVEYARRGYVVMAIDMYGHGNSDPVTAEEWYVQGTGMYDAVELMATFPYVDTERIGVTGHSNGARACNLSVDVDNTKENPLISAVLLVANDATYRNPETKEYWNKYGSRDVGIIAALYDEFFFRTYDAEGNILTPPREYINTANAQSFLNFGIDPETGGEVRESYHIYKQDVDGTEAARVIYNPNQIHPWNHFSKTCVTSALEFFEDAFGAPNPIAANNQVWQWKVVFNVIGLIGFVMFMMNFAIMMLDTKAFQSLKAKETVKIGPAPKGAGIAWFWGGLAVSALISGISFIKLYPAVSKIAKAMPFFAMQSPVFFIGSWSAFCGLATLLILIISYQCYGKKNGVNLKTNGVCISGKKLLLTIGLALVTVAAAYSLVFIADYFCKTDFRIWVIAVKAFTPDKILISLRYVVFFLVFYIMNSISVNCFNYVAVGKKEWVNTAVLAVANGLSAVVLCAIQYGTFFAKGLPMFKSTIIYIWLFPVIVILPVAAVISRKIYRQTNNPYLAGIINAVIVTLISCTNTLTQLM